MKSAKFRKTGLFSDNWWRILNSKKLFAAFIALFVIFALLQAIIYSVSAAPIGPDTLTPVSSSRRAESPALNTTAIAGNVTALEINVTQVTQSWQGYYGNVSGVITLDDANNKSMYSWTDVSPAGEVYAVRTPNSVSWASINCSTLTQISTEETALNIGATDKDGINETFNKTLSNTFYIGALNMTAGTCQYSQFLYENDAPAVNNYFEEVLLHDGTYIVYTAIINQNKAGFDAGAHDFQMLVGEDGHNGNSAVSNYYFYVELG